MKFLAKKRKQEGKTNYLKRKKLLSGMKPRIVIRKTNRNLILQYVESRIAQDKVKYMITSKILLEYGWPAEKSGSLKSLPACYLSGFLFGKILSGEEAIEPVLDTGLIKSTKGSRVYAALKGIIDSGVKMKHDAKIFPAEKNIENEKTSAFFNKVKDNIIKDKILRSKS